MLRHRRPYRRSGRRCAGSHHRLDAGSPRSAVTQADALGTHRPPAPRLVAALANIPRQTESPVSCLRLRRQGQCQGTVGCRREALRASSALTPLVALRAPASPTAMLHGGLRREDGWPSAGGWKTPLVVLRTYAHALHDPTVTVRDFLWAQNPTQSPASTRPSGRNEKEKRPRSEAPRWGGVSRGCA